MMLAAGIGAVVAGAAAVCAHATLAERMALETTANPPTAANQLRKRPAHDVRLMLAHIKLTIDVWITLFEPYRARRINRPMCSSEWLAPKRVNDGRETRATTRIRKTAAHGNGYQTSYLSARVDGDLATLNRALER